MTKIYHTALAKGSVTYSDIPETDFASHRLGLMVKNDIIINGLPSHFLKCDVLYAEPPWPHGFKVFNERAGANHASYNDLAAAIGSIIEEEKKPTYLLLGKQMLSKLPSPAQVEETILNGNDAMIAIWNDHYTGDISSTEAICKHLGSRYYCIGDFTCGYGACVRNFLEGGGSCFVAADYDGKCITVMNAQMKKIP